MFLYLTGGIMFDGEVNGHNLNLLALKQGFAKPNPEVFGYHAAALSGGGHHGIIGGRGPATPQAAMTAYASWDRDYYDYQQIGAGNKRMNGQQKFPTGGGKTPAQQRLRQPMMPQACFILLYPAPFETFFFGPFFLPSLS